MGRSISFHFSCKNSPAMPPGPEFKYLYVHHTAKSTFQSCRASGTFPIPCARSQPHIQPCYRVPVVSHGFHTNGENKMNAEFLCVHKALNTYLIFRLFRNLLHREPLACVILHTAENHERNSRSFLFYEVKDIFFSKCEFA